MLSPPLSHRTILVLAILAPTSALLYLASAAVMKVQCLTCATSTLVAPISDPVLNATPEALNESNSSIIPAPDGASLFYNGTGNVPSYHETSPAPAPISPLNSTSAVANSIYLEVVGVVNGTSFQDDCTKCVAAAEILHIGALTQPVTSFVEILIKICETIPAVQTQLYAANCRAQFGSVPNGSLPYSNGAAGLGAYYAQLFSKMSITTGDFDLYCHEVWSVCPEPRLPGIEESLYFDPKPDFAHTSPEPSGKTLKVLHLSDWHLDPRYDIGSEANCTAHLCCRPDSRNTNLDSDASHPSLSASRFGSLLCDTPPDLALSSFHSMPKFFNISDLSFSIFTGDIVSHDFHDALSRAYVEYSETVSYNMFKSFLGDVPLYATLGNHDSFPQGFNTPNSLAPTNALSWNYDLLSSLWHNASYLTDPESTHAKTHYAAYAHTHPSGLRIISLNTDFWYTRNIFAYLNATNPDPSGLLAFLAAELSACESRSQRVWILGHIPPGHPTDALPHSTSLFYSLIVRFSPHTIAGLFFGHTHRQHHQLIYDFAPDSLTADPVTGVLRRNTSRIDRTKPLAPVYIGPSIVPLTNLNAGYTLYTVDGASFEVLAAQTYIANMSESLRWGVEGPVWEFEYEARETYAPLIERDGKGAWGVHEPLNATFWDRVAGVVERDVDVARVYALFETKSSVVTPECGVECGRRKACEMRSGSGWLARRCGR